MSAPQGTPEWLQERCGKLGASSIGDLMARTKSGYGASRANLMSRLLTEILTGRPTDGFTSAAMAWGTETEPQARAAYEFMQGVQVVETGFLLHPDIPGAGCSPDGLVGDDGLVEIKCPNTATHLETLLGGAIDKRYMLQMQWQMDVTGRQWCDFVSFDPRLPMRMHMHRQRVSRDEELLTEIRQEVRKFLGELEAKVRALNELYSDNEHQSEKAA